MSEIIVVDGANVAYGEESKDGRPKVANLTLMRKALEARGFDPIVVVDASLAHHVDDEEQIKALFEQQRLRQAPAGTDADYFVLSTAEDHEARVVTNDTYEKYREQFPWIEERRLPFMIIKGQVELYQPQLDGNTGEAGGAVADEETGERE